MKLKRGMRERREREGKRGVLKTLGEILLIFNFKILLLRFFCRNRNNRFK